MKCSLNMQRYTLILCLYLIARSFAIDSDPNMSAPDLHCCQIAVFT